MARAVALGLLLSSVIMVASPAFAADDGLEAARRIVFSALPEICDSDLAERLPGLEDTVHDVHWSETDYEGKPVQKAGTLYEIGCYAGAYNLVVAYVFAAEDGFPQQGELVTFATPAFSVDYAADDDTNTKLARDPVVTGFGADTTLINPSFDPDTNTISTFEKWRGLGDAASWGRWTLQDGRFVLTYYAIDPIYEANLEDPPEDLHDTVFVLYDASR
ncbi:DUF1176 domain-containing protein [Martelella endophytica]|uniref:DUF1176 domain-containing protein n=1 Tax=Martelella endophytica TaxID=1486262 RepID=A0A0D5LUY8_MAREN|nr:DUF1176 domain-containing protein [Martelella endophytica]AJY47188.1 hypothetical protein TM49_18335 [Martelella endophytica]